MLIIYHCCESCVLFCFPALTRVIFQPMRWLLGCSGRAGRVKPGFLEHEKVEFELGAVQDSSR